MDAKTVALAAFLCSACALPGTVGHAADTLDMEAPPAELGRPWWVRGPAGFGAWVGAIGGAVVAVAALPITYPITLIADEPLGYSEQEFLFFPVTAFASGGHFVLGAPLDMLDFTFRRAWVEAPFEPDYEYTPMQPPVGPGQGEELLAEDALELVPAEQEKGAEKKPPDDGR